MTKATPGTQPLPRQPLAIWNPIREIWVTTQLDLFGQQELYSVTWPTSGMTRNGLVFRLQPSAHPILDTGYSSSPIALFRTPLASDASRGRETLQQVHARRGTIALSHQIIDIALHGPNGYPRGQEPETLWHLIDEIFNDGESMPPPSLDGHK